MAQKKYMKIKTEHINKFIQVFELSQLSEKQREAYNKLISQFE